MTTPRKGLATPRDAFVQIAGAATIGLSFLWLWRHSFPGSTLVLSGAMLALLLYSHHTRQDSLRQLGFRLDTAFAAAKFLVPAGAVVVTAVLVAGNNLGTLHFPAPREAAETLAKVIVFGILQQYLLLGFFLSGIDRFVRSAPAATLATAAIFAVFHVPNAFLVIATFASAFVAIFVYRRAPNIWVSGVVHGIVSYTFYFALPATITGGLRVGPQYWSG